MRKSLPSHRNPDWYMASSLVAEPLNLYAESLNPCSSAVPTVATVKGDKGIEGTVHFEQADENSPTTITWNITGNDANAKRGMHVHQFGDNTNGCTSAGPHCKSSRDTQGARKGGLMR